MYSNFYPRPPRGGRLVCFLKSISSQVISIHALREEGDTFPFTVTDCCIHISIHALREEGDKPEKVIEFLFGIFLSTPSARRATGLFFNGDVTFQISIHALREEGDHNNSQLSIFGLSFLSTPSARRATTQTASRCHGSPHFYPRPPRGGRPPLTHGAESDPAISIHALREEGDVGVLKQSLNLGYFYPRPPRGGRHDGMARLQNRRKHFYPRPPRGGRPPPAARQIASISNFYPRPPRGGRRSPAECSAGRPDISIHALREEGDFVVILLGVTGNISIHALREEGDSIASATPSAIIDFYPRPPRGGRLCGVDNIHHRIRNFYPRPPRGGRLSPLSSPCPALPISIHALREEGDFLFGTQRIRFFNFYPRPPRGGRLILGTALHTGIEDFYPRPPRGGRPAAFVHVDVRKTISIHALREEGDNTSGSTV